MFIGEKGRSVQLLTADISYSGIFVRTEVFIDPRQLVRVRLRIPDTGQELRLLEVVVHLIKWDSDHGARKGPGMGLNFYGLSGDVRDKWDGFVSRATALNDAQSLDGPADRFPEVAKLVAPIRRHHPRAVGQFQVRMDTVHELHNVLSRDISAGGSFLHHPDLLPPRTRLQLTFVHPIDGSEFVLEAMIVRVVEAPPEERGMGVEFLDCSEDQREAFLGFIRSGNLEPASIDSFVLEIDESLLE